MAYQKKCYLGAVERFAELYPERHDCASRAQFKRLFPLILPKNISPR
ncbi:MAG: hypothetical protein MSH49_02210 [[Eubacterium] saphenum]|nr:hypothetical protein [[Eubacterium] saphenum]